MIKNRILIGVCTYKRIKMLRNCLKQCMSLEHDGLIVEILVGNNEVHSDTDEKLSDLVKDSTIPIRIETIEQRGIPIVRNRILDVADKEGFHYCIFIDDDEWPEADWLVKLIVRFGVGDVDAVQGNVIYVYERVPWLTKPILKSQKFDRPDDYIARSASTCNVAINRKIFGSEALAMRFDELMALSGGSDSEFFRRACKFHGVTIGFERKAIVKEKIPVSRTTLLWYFRHRSRVSSNLFYIRRNHHGRTVLSQFGRDFVKHFIYLIRGTLLGLIFLFFFIYPPMGRAALLNCIRYTAQFCGFLCAVLGFSNNTYLNVTGE